MIISLIFLFQIVKTNKLQPKSMMKIGILIMSLFHNSAGLDTTSIRTKSKFMKFNSGSETVLKLMTFQILKLKSQMMVKIGVKHWELYKLSFQTVGIHLSCLKMANPSQPINIFVLVKLNLANSQRSISLVNSSYNHLNKLNPLLKLSHKRLNILEQINLSLILRLRQLK